MGEMIHFCMYFREFKVTKRCPLILSSDVIFGIFKFSFWGHFFVALALRFCFREIDLDFSTTSSCPLGEAVSTLAVGVKHATNTKPTTQSSLLVMEIGLRKAYNTS